MPATQAHIEQAKSNERLAEHLARSPYADWRCTALYYAALHYIQAYFSGLNPPQVFERHALRDEAIRLNRSLKAIRNDYRSLKDWSQDARYELRKPSVGDFSTDIEPSLIAIKRHLRTYVPGIEV